MLTIRPKGANHTLNKNREGGLNPLHVRTSILGLKDGSTTREYVSAWEPTPEELVILNLGGHVECSLIGVQPAVLLKAVDAAEPLGFDHTRESRNIDGILKLNERLRKFYCEQLDEWKRNEESGEVPIYERQKAILGLEVTNQILKLFKALKEFKDADPNTKAR